VGVEGLGVSNVHVTGLERALASSPHPTPVLEQHIHVIIVVLIEKKRSPDSKQVEGGAKTKFGVETAELGSEVARYNKVGKW
jgi:hypothetical protein